MKPTTKNDNRCRAIGSTSGERCKRTASWGLGYCRQHQPLKTIALTAVLTFLATAAFNFILNVLSNRYSERAPRLAVRLNNEPLAQDVVMVYPTNSGQSWFTFFVENEGDMDAQEMFIRIVTSPLASNVVYGEKWLHDEIGTFGVTNPFLDGMFQKSDRAIPPKFGGKFQPFSIDSTRCEVFCGFVNCGAIGAQLWRGRMHVFFENPAGITNVYRDVEAKRFLQSKDPKIAENMDQGIFRLAFASTNEVLKLRTEWPSAVVIEKQP